MKANLTRIIVTFVHNREEDQEQFKELNKGVRPAIWEVIVKDQLKVINQKIHCYSFPRDYSDFNLIGKNLKGFMPDKGSNISGSVSPKYGITGFKHYDGKYYAATWNGIYVLDKDLFPINFVSNKLMCDPHGLFVDKEGIWTALTGKDTLVLTDFDGRILNYATINPDLSLTYDKSLEETDWRFITKEKRGSTGWWHFNSIQKYGDEILLLSRNASCFVSINLKSDKARLRLMNLREVNLLHDGYVFDGKFTFTSIDGGIILAKEVDEKEKGKFNYDLDTEHTLLSQKLDNGTRTFVNWCRGIYKFGDIFYTTLNGRYDSDEGFILGAVKEDFKEAKWIARIVDCHKELKYTTGFSVYCEEVKEEI